MARLGAAKKNHLPRIHPNSSLWCGIAALFQREIASSSGIA
jgi:hypothetical protein